MAASTSNIAELIQKKFNESIILPSRITTASTSHSAVTTVAVGGLGPEFSQFALDTGLMVNIGAVHITTVPIDEDYHAWLLGQAALLRNHEFGSLDWSNLAEELEDMGVGLRHALKSDLEVVLHHLLKLQYEPSPNEWRGRSRSWKVSAVEHRNRIFYLIDDSANLRNRMTDFVAEVYPHAVELASIDTGRPERDFPKDCPWSVHEILHMSLPSPFALET